MRFEVARVHIFQRSRNMKGARGLRSGWLAGFVVLWLVGCAAFAKSAGPYAEEIAALKTNLKAFPTVKKVALIGVVEVLEDLRSGKQDFLYQKIPSQKLALRFNYLMPQGFTVITRSAADVQNLLKEQNLTVGDLINVSQVGALGQALGADALLVGSYYSGTKNGYDVEVQSSIFVKLLDVKTGALIWTRELDKKDLQVPAGYSKVAGPAPAP
jgi:hypothetical protein